jgi:CheY-like chemotaxis protein
MSAQLLLVDDEPGVRVSVKEYLQEVGGFTVQVASNADEAWQMLQHKTPDLVISDIMMPQGRWVSVSQKAARRPSLQGTACRVSHS